MTRYFTRQDAMTQATTVFSPVETGVDGTTAGPVKLPVGSRRITSVNVIAITDGAYTETGQNFVVQLSGPGMLDGTQEIVVYGVEYQEGGGSVTATAIKLLPVAQIPVNIPVRAGNDISIAAAYVGTDSGNQYIAVTLEVE